MAASLAAAAGGLLVVVGRDGTPGWQVARGAAVLLAAGAMAWAVLGDGRPIRAVGAFAGGTAAAAAGGGLAVPHLAKVGLTSLSVAGLSLLVGGAALLVHGARILIVHASRGARLLVVPLLGAFAVLLLSCLGIAVAATNVPRTAVGARTPAAADLPYDDVSFPTEDGVMLSGWYIPSDNGAAVVLVHGAGSTRSGVLDHAVLLARHGYGALLFDARGHGRSGGRAMDLGWYGDEDIAAAVSFLEGQPDVTDGRIAAVGLSMGGEAAIGAAAQDERIRAVVGEGVTGRTAADKAWLSDVHGWRGLVQEGIDHLLFGAVDVLTSASPPPSLRHAVAATAPRPVLLIAAGEVPDEGDAGRFIRTGAPDSVEIWIAPHSGHTGALETHPGEWAARVLAFLADAIGPGG
jgi:alpha/beta superfamily hydrolase